MSVDMSQFYQVFFEEAEEHLATMERLLLGLDVQAPSLEDLNAIFRAAHSIKGGAGTFGFTDMTEVTHVLETLLDRLRKEELALRPEMVDAFLAAGDVLRVQLAHHQGGPEADGEDVAAVCARLAALSEDGRAAPSAPPRRYVIECTLPDELARDATRRRALLAALGELGEIQYRHKPTARSPRLACEITTAQGQDELLDALGFHVDPATLSVRDLDEARAAEAPAEDEGFGFFDDAPGVPAAATQVDDGFGFFDDAPGAPAPRPNAGRRASDDPAVETVRTGRRETDKIAISASAESSSIRVAVEKVDQLINLVGELVITQAMLAQSASHLDPVAAERLLAGIDLLARNTRDLQESVMSIRMLPMSMVFNRFPRVVRDLAHKFGKQVELVTVGENTELDKSLIEKITDPLTHLVRNSLDHGIETPETRLAAGKPAKGTLTLRASHQGGNIVIEVADDGAGLKRDKILAKARERGLPVHEGMSDAEVWQLIFMPGFSTADQVTDVSGRGVGMDVVKRNIDALGGRVEVSSEAGRGTRVAIQLPLTLAILDGMSVAVGEETFIVPLTYIVESLQPNADDLRTIAGEGQVVHVRGEYLPLLPLYRLFNLRARATDPTGGVLVIVETGGGRAALLVDELLGEHQVVIKSLEANYRRVAGIAGATIMGDGRVALILDVAGVARLMQTPAAVAA